ncbi:MAG: hypothetical protein WC707_01345 [Candidatus Babeliaceae bacterium]|jgi:hypothetical protein
MFKQALPYLAFIPAMVYGQQLSLHNGTFAPMYIEISSTQQKHNPLIIKEYKKNSITLPENAMLRVYSCMLHPVSKQPMFREMLYEFYVPSYTNEIKLMHDHWEIIS